MWSGHPQALICNGPNPSLDARRTTSAGFWRTSAGNGYIPEANRPTDGCPPWESLGPSQIPEPILDKYPPPTLRPPEGLPAKAGHLLITAGGGAALEMRTLIEYERNHHNQPGPRSTRHTPKTPTRPSFPTVGISPLNSGEAGRNT